MATRKKKKAKAGVGRPARRAAPASGPVTLEEARALARARHPAATTASTVRRGARAAVKLSATPGTVGLEKRKLDITNQRELQRRVTEYKATLNILKERGATNVSAGGRRRAAAAAPKVVSNPLQILAEGDSWFDYPALLFGGGVIPRLEKRMGLPILNLADAGDEVRFMLGVEQRKKLIKHLKQGNPAGVKWDVLLFSGGGNDIVDNPMALWIRDFDANIPLPNHIHQARLDAALTLVKAGYEDLIDLRDKLSPDTTLIFHAYDFAIPDGRGICNLGPWLQPTFKLRNFPSTQAAFEVVKAMLLKFAAMLQALAGAQPKVEFVLTQGTMQPVTASWHNELHPHKKGFEQFAALFHDKLRALFPARVL